jgi:hypothetical protein
MLNCNVTRTNRKLRGGSPDMLRFDAKMIDRINRRSIFLRMVDSGKMIK